MYQPVICYSKSIWFSVSFHQKPITNKFKVLVYSTLRNTRGESNGCGTAVHVNTIGESNVCGTAVHVNIYFSPRSFNSLLSLSIYLHTQGRMECQEIDRERK